MISRFIKQKCFRSVVITTALLLFVFPVSCDRKETKTTEVTATAYNSLPEQTDTDGNIAAWGDELKPGMKAIAVSRDLIRQGLEYNTEVKIEGFPGTFRVLDKMPPRWKNRIDIYMGEDRKAAKHWGKKKVTISWEVEKTDSNP